MESHQSLFLWLFTLLIFGSSVESGVHYHLDGTINSRPSLRGRATQDVGRQLELFHWLFGNSRSEPVNPHNNSTNNSNGTKSTPPSEPVILGPIQVSDIQNSSLKRISLTPAFEKGLRDEIYKYNLEQSSISKKRSDETQLRKSVKKRSIQRAARSLPRKVDGSSQLLSKRQGLLYPQQQHLLLQQQAAAYQQQQQHLLALQSQQQRYGGGGLSRYNARNRRPYLYDDYDDDSDSDEYDDFDSDEFMSYPVRAGFMPPGMPGFRGRK